MNENTRQGLKMIISLEIYFMYSKDNQKDESKDIFKKSYENEGRTMIFMLDDDALTIDDVVQYCHYQAEYLNHKIDRLKDSEEVFGYSGKRQFYIDISQKLNEINI